MKVTSLALACLVLPAAAMAVEEGAPAPTPAPRAAGPQPGDVYREYVYATRFGELDPGATAAGSQNLRAGSGKPRPLTVGSLKGATRAEVSVQYWGGHIGTSDQKLRVNGSDWYQIPQPEGTPTEPQCYYRTVVGDNPVAIPLALVKEGENVFEFGAGKQIRHGFNWGFFWVYSFTLRVYYDAATPHPAGRVTAPAAGAALGDSPVLTAEASSPNGAVKQVDFIGLYEDYDWEGNGVYRQWHTQFLKGVPARHLGTAKAAPYSVTWDATWVPDQKEPMSIMARIVDETGMIAMTEAVEGLTLARAGRSVRMVRASKMPEAFGVRVGKRMSCTLDVPEDPAKATAARLVISTWSAAHADELAFNGTRLVERIGPVHNVSFDSIPVPLELIRKGENQFSIFSATKEHAAEVNWPGPALLLEFRR